MAMTNGITIDMTPVMMAGTNRPGCCAGRRALLPRSAPMPISIAALLRAAAGRPPRAAPRPRRHGYDVGPAVHQRPQRSPGARAATSSTAIDSAPIGHAGRRRTQAPRMSANPLARRRQRSPDPRAKQRRRPQRGGVSSATRRVRSTATRFGDALHLVEVVCGEAGTARRSLAQPKNQLARHRGRSGSSPEVGSSSSTMSRLVEQRSRQRDALLQPLSTAGRRDRPCGLPMSNSSSASSTVRAGFGEAVQTRIRPEGSGPTVSRSHRPGASVRNRFDRAARSRLARHRFVVDAHFAGRGT